MSLKPPIRYDFEISVTPEGVGIRGVSLKHFTWTRNGDLPRMMEDLHKHLLNHTRTHRKRTPTRALYMVGCGYKLSCFVFTA